jgi:citrate lyase subunit beta / citryl-CoA lyase
MAGQQVRRSWLIIPGTQAGEIERSWTVGADVIVLDLEDLVHDARKHDARENIERGIDQARRGGAEVFVRCDLELLYADLEASVWRGLQGIILPKITSVEQIREAEETLAHFEAKHGVVQAGLVGEVNEFDEPRTIENALELHLSLENAKGNYAAEDLIAASPRVKSISLGRADLVMDLRPEPNGELHLMRYLMQRLIVVANATGVSPIGAWWQGNSRGLRATAADTLEAAHLGRAAGFKGALCVAPDQVSALNQGFTPSSQEVREAERITRAFAEAQAAGRPYGQIDGVLIDSATAEAAQASIDWASACAARDAFKAAAAAREPAPSGRG